MRTMPGTMGLSMTGYILMWVVMMGAMMLPSIAPLASRYVGLIETNWLVGALTFSLGYLAVWAGIGLLAYGLSWLTGTIAAGNQTVGVTFAAATFAACGLYQFSSVKNKCLDKCRAPFSLLLEYGSWRGPARHLRVGLHHGIFCLGCCVMLMALMFVFGVMNIWAMMILMLVVAVEKVWGENNAFPRFVGVACFALALAVLWFPQLAPGMVPSM